MHMPHLILAQAMISIREEATKTLVAIVIPVVAAATFTLITIGLTRLNQWLQLRRQGSNAVFWMLAEKIGELAANVVANLEVTLKPGLKAKTEDGQLHADEIRELRDEAVRAIRESLSAEELFGLRQKLGGDRQVDTFLEGKVERAVRALGPGKALVLAASTTQVP